MAFRASWMARCIMACIRDSWGWILHPSLPGLPAFAFQSVTTSAHTRADHTKLSVRKQIELPGVNVLMDPPFAGAGAFTDQTFQRRPLQGDLQRHPVPG